MSKDSDGIDFVTDNNTGGHFVCECQNCGEVFNSQNMDGGEPNADAGDFGDCYCPKCGQVDPEECTNANLVWNVQQKKINAINVERDELLSALQEVVAISDRKHDAWDRAHAAIDKAKGGAA